MNIDADEAPGGSPEVRLERMRGGGGISWRKCKQCVYVRFGVMYFWSAIIFIGFL